MEKHVCDDTTTKIYLNEIYGTISHPGIDYIISHPGLYGIILHPLIDDTTCI